LASRRTWPRCTRCYILVKDGTEPIAVTESHGAWLEWLG
jgi:hypothetical protein